MIETKTDRVSVKGNGLRRPEPIKEKIDQSIEKRESQGWTFHSAIPLKFTRYGSSELLTEMLIVYQRER